MQNAKQAAITLKFNDNFMTDEQLVQNYDQTIFNSSLFWKGLSAREKTEIGRRALLMPSKDVISNLETLISQFGGCYCFPAE